MRNSAEEAFNAAIGHPNFGVKFCLGFLVNDVPVPALPTDKKRPAKK